MNEISVFPIGKLNHVVVYDCPSSIRKEIESVFPFISLIVGYILLSLLHLSLWSGNFMVFVFGLFLLLQSIKLYSIAILLRPAALCFTIRH